MHFRESHINKQPQNLPKITGLGLCFSKCSTMRTFKDHPLVRLRIRWNMVNPKMYMERYEGRCVNGQTQIQNGKYHDTFVEMENRQQTRAEVSVNTIPGRVESSSEYNYTPNLSNPRLLCPRVRETGEIRRFVGSWAVKEGSSKYLPPNFERIISQSFFRTKLSPENKKKANNN